MVTQVQKRVPIGIDGTAGMFYLNEAFRKLNQLSKGGFVWQIKQATLAFAGSALTVAAPADFDPGKQAVLRGLQSLPVTYFPWKDFVRQENFTVVPEAGLFTAWTYRPNFVFGPPTTYGWTIQVGPAAAANPVAMNLTLVYHAVNFAPFTAAANVFFPTPDQFDSAIVDLAVAQAKEDYGISGFDRVAQQANQALAEMIDTYRSDRFDLAGLFDETAQAKEKQTERDR